jgi:hypothetical protein
MDFTKEKKYLYKLALIFGALLSIFVFVKIIGEARAYRLIGSNPDVKSAISVTGEGEVFAVPDIATISFGATEQATTAKGAQDKVPAKINPAIQYLRDAGIDEKDIKTTSVNLSPRYENTGGPCTQYSCPPSNAKIVGYEASQYMEVKIRNTESAGEILAGLTEKGATNISGPNFSIDDEDALASEARAEAIADAKARAEKLADDLDVRLVRIIEFNESGGTPHTSKHMKWMPVVQQPIKQYLLQIYQLEKIKSLQELRLLTRYVR